MIVTVQGCRDVNVIEEMKHASYFYALSLLSSKMIPHITVNIIIKRKLEDLGNCMITFYNDWYKAREFEIQIRYRSNINLMLLTLAHEFVHLKQFAKGELNESTDTWKGQPINADVTPYNDLPWEVEAVSLEHDLFNQYLLYKNITKYPDIKDNA